MILAVAPEVIAEETDVPGGEIVAPKGRASPIGKHLRHRLPDGTYLHLVVPLKQHGRLVATVPLGSEGLDRMEAIQRLLADLHRRRSIPREPV